MKFSSLEMFFVGFAYKKYGISYFIRRKTMTILFQLALAALVILSFAMVVGVPVAYASPQNWDQSKRLIFLGSALWVGLVLVVGGLNYLVV
jgi:photosystem II PsbZ protein